MNKKQMKQAAAYFGKKGGETTALRHKDKLSEWGKKGARIKKKLKQSLSTGVNNTLNSVK